MPEDLIYLAALVDMQSSMLHLLMLHGNPLPPEAWKFADLHSENGRMRHWKMGRSMHSHICKEMRNHAGA